MKRQSTGENRRRRYVVIGTGSRAELYVTALLTTHAAAGELVGFLDTNEIRMRYYDRLAAGFGHAEPIPHYGPADLERMLVEARPDTVIVTSPDYTHMRYIVTALESGVNVITEKPMTIDADSARAIATAAEASTASLVVTFNYRYSPRNSAVRELLLDGAIGDVTSVHFEWCLDTSHGADYFRRWHRVKEKSGGLLVHKSTHHFDLVNWWLHDIPETVFALGGLRFYGDRNAAARGLGPRPEYSRDGIDIDDPFALNLRADPKLTAFYLNAEPADGYRRDRDVFSSGITIEDNMTVAVGYQSGVSLAYTLVAHSPWEGYRVAFNGTEGRLDLEVVERGWLSPNGGVVDPSAAHDSTIETQPLRAEGATLVLQRLWQRPQLIPVAEALGGHGGGDDVLLNDVLVGPGEDPLRRQAGYRDGLRSIIVGIAGNESMRTGLPVRVRDYGLPVGRE